jgi:hypothetical protein
MLGDVGNMPPLPGIFPDYSAPIVRNHRDGRELVMARWGMPSPKSVIEGRKSDHGATNIRNVASPHRRRWLAGVLTVVDLGSNMSAGGQGDGLAGWRLRLRQNALQALLKTDVRPLLPLPGLPEADRQRLRAQRSD